jgi:hypothetical protein
MEARRKGILAVGLAIAFLLTSIVANTPAALAADSSSTCPGGDQALTNAVAAASSSDAQFKETLQATIVAFDACLANTNLTDVGRGTLNVSQAAVRLTLIRVLHARILDPQSQGESATQVGRVGDNLNQACSVLDRISASDRDLVKNNIAPSYFGYAHEINAVVPLGLQLACQPSIAAFKQGINFGN